MTDEVVLGALLHDIGEFSTRAGGLRKDGEGEKASDDPLAYAANFFRDALGGRFPAAEKVVLHHRNPAAGPDRTAALTAALADRLSSGKSGPPDGDGETGQDPGARLLSIFSGLVPKESRDKPGPPMYFPLKALTVDMEAHFPTPPAETGDGEGLPALWADFVAEVRRLDFSDDSRFFRQLLSLLEKYTLFIPMAARGPDRDVSLFHHLKSSAAIASCLSQLNLPESTLQALYAGEDGAGEDDTGQDGVGEDDTGEDDAGEDDAGEDGAGEDDAGQDDTGQDGVGEDDAGEDGAENPLDEEAFYLVGADLSGIQSFIYSVASKGALKGLRGRSLYLTLLVETTAESILREIGLNPSCLIYSGGGHFR
ncbi:MAG: HD domain-containing protein, partial [Desulfobacterales bacterium]|nr:HD domain-containing protein [Desulfobacterales bacterium]